MIRALCTIFGLALAPASFAQTPLVQQAYLKASNPGVDDAFGHAVSISGDTLVIGAHREDSGATGAGGDQHDESAPLSGAVYVFVRSGTVWTQQAYLKASNTDGGDHFGWSVSISGDTIVVGALGDGSGAMGVDGDQGDDGAPLSGAAYVFVRSGTVWSQQAYLKASNTGAFDHFGESVSISGDTVVVGASGEDSGATGVGGSQGDESAESSGAAYVFVRNGAVWSQQAYLKASNTGGGDNFGNAVSVSGDMVVVGAQNEDSGATGVGGNQLDDGAENAGAAYVFVRNGAVWSQQAYLKASNAAFADQFGHSVSASGDTVVVGAWREDSNATGVDGDQGDESARQSGAVYAFARNGAVWSQQAYLKASNTGAGDVFGGSVSSYGDTLVIGALHEDSDATGVNGDQLDDSAAGAGAAYVFARSGTSWSQLAYVKASNTGAADNFGSTVCVSAGTVVVGAQGEDGSAPGIDGNQSDDGAAAAGAAYVLREAGGGPTLVGDVATIDAIAGGVQTLALSAAAFPNELFLLVGTTSGTSPGFVFQGFPVPLNPFGSYFLSTLVLAAPQLSLQLGALDAVGGATVTLTVPAGSPPALVGTVVSHAYAVLSAAPLTIAGVSNAAHVALTGP
jgi:hypothetical protein